MSKRIRDFSRQSTYYLFPNSLSMTCTNRTDSLLIGVFQLSQLSLFLMQPVILQCTSTCNKTHLPPLISFKHQQQNGSVLTNITYDLPSMHMHKTNQWIKHHACITWSCTASSLSNLSFSCWTDSRSFAALIFDCSRTYIIWLRHIFVCKTK